MHRRKPAALFVVYNTTVLGASQENASTKRLAMRLKAYCLHRKTVLLVFYNSYLKKHKLYRIIYDVAKLKPQKLDSLVGVKLSEPSTSLRYDWS